jgi:L-seryl-tRNA(Ser) seleniumtransferase
MGDAFAVEQIDCASQVGSGALPVETVPSAGLAIRARNTSGKTLAALSNALRALPMPVIGRIEDNALVLDLRCLEDGDAFLANLAKLDPGAPAVAQESKP